MSRPLCVASLIVAMWGLAVTAYAQPTVANSAPMAVVPGQATELTLQGDKLDAPLRIWTSFPATAEWIATGSTPQAYKCKLTLDASVPVGIGGIIVGNATGASDPLYVLVDDLPTVADNGNNHARESAQSIELPVAVDGASDGTVYDYYKFTAKAGQRISVETVAARLGSPFDGVVRLLDPQGTELVFVDDDPSLGADCRFAYTVTADGEYVLEVHDNKYGGGRYRLRVGDFPLVTTAYPLGGRRGSTTRLGFSGPLATGVDSVLLTIGHEAPGGQRGVGARFPGGKSSGLATLVTSDLPEAAEVEPNNSPETGSPIVTPSAVSGQLDADGDQDLFQFLATGGQRLTFHGLSRSLGSPSVLVMRLLKPDGSLLAESAVGGNEEETFTAVIPETGTYRLVVEDIFKRGGAGHTYRVEIEAGNSFALVLKNDANTKDKLVLPVGDGAVAIDVQCVRYGYDGPIRLSLENGGPLRLLNDVIPEKAGEVKAMIILPPDLPPGELRGLRIVGTATIDGREVTRPAHTAAFVHTKLPSLSYPPAWRDGLLILATTGKVDPFYRTSVDKPVIRFPRQVGQTEFTLTLERKHQDFKAAISVLHQQLPPGFALAVKQENDTYKATLTGPKDLPEGWDLLELISYGEMGRGQTVVHRLPIEVIEPLAVSIVPAGPIVAGQVQKVKIRLARKGDDRQAVTVKFVKLPPGVSAAGEFTVPAEQDELDVDLTAGPDAAAVKFEQLTVEANTKYTGQDVHATSGPAVLEVTKP